MVIKSRHVFGSLPALFFFVILLDACWALGLPCNGKIVDTGETMKQVASKCGEAMLKEQRVVKVEDIDEGGARSAITNKYDEWTYDFGPEEQMQSYLFENGKLVGIGSPGYGRKSDDMTDNCRNGETLAVGDSYLDAYLKCGEPIAREKLPDRISETMDGKRKRTLTETVVEWTYRYGPDAPGYTLRIENGRVTDIRTRKFGE